MADLSSDALPQLSVSSKPDLPPLDALPELSVPGKRELMAQLQSRLDVGFVRSPLWAAFWLADIGVVRKVVGDLATGGLSAVYVQCAIDQCQIDVVLKQWQTKHRPVKVAAGTPNQSIPTTPIQSSPQPPTSSTKKRKSIGSAELDSSDIKKAKTRNRDVIERCRERDNYKCVLSNYDEYDICHIYPWCLNGQEGTEDQRTFWKTMRMFWPEDKVDAWRAAVTSEHGTEILQNLLALNPTLHREWGNARWALQPIRVEDDGTKLLVRYYRLPQYPREIAVPMAQEPVLPADYAAAGIRPILSGDIIELRTSDPARLPLPSMAILEMQWVLHRVLALAGAADSSLDTWDSDSDSDTEVCLGPSIKHNVSPAMLHEESPTALHDVVSNLSLSRAASVPPEPERGRILLGQEDPGITGSENRRPSLSPQPALTPTKSKSPVPASCARGRGQTSRSPHLWNRR
ncbi:hypothetical protein N7527_011816 [Penicillium freii]|nr:hypothetical protein N7527_011816 [Penicillium freii]